MPKDPDLSKHTINLRRGDIDYIATIAQANGIPSAFIVRKIISNFVDKMKAKEEPMKFEGEI